MSSDPAAAAKGKAQKPQRATTASRNRADSPPPYRSTDSTSIQDFANESAPCSALFRNEAPPHLGAQDWRDSDPFQRCSYRFWQHAMNVAEHHPDDFKHQALPLARIKKVAKMDPELQNQMISSEVTVLFEKACQIFIQELTARAHLRSLASRRRMISRADVAAAVSRSDMFDFLIDIVPRPERSPSPLPAQYANDQQHQETYPQAGPSYSAAYGDGTDNGGDPVASTSAAAGERDDAGAGYNHQPPPPQSNRPTRSSARSRRYSERGSDFETDIGTEYRGIGGGGEASSEMQQHMLDLEQPPPPPPSTHSRRGQKPPPERKRQRVEIPGAGGQLLAAVGGPIDETVSSSSSSSTSVPSTSTTGAAPSLTIPVSLGEGAGAGGGPPHLHPTGLPNPNLGPQPGSAPAPIVDAETLRQAYAAVAGSMPPGLFMPHTLMGAMSKQSAAQRGVDGEDDGAAAAEAGGGARPMPWPPAFGFPSADAGSVLQSDGLGNFYAQGMDADDEQQDLDQDGDQVGQ